MESRLFRSQHLLGQVCNALPLQIRHIKKHQDTFIITSVGRKFHTYSAAKLHLYSTSEIHPSEITCLIADPRYVYTACQDGIRVFKRGIHPESFHPVADVRLLMPFGELIVAVARNSLIVLERDSGNVYLELPFASTFKISCLCHPATYINKIVLGSEQGSLQLWNVHSATNLFQFAGWGQPVTCIEQSPALDVLACGLANGQIVLHNIKTDTTIMKFRQEWGSVSSITFRTDGPPLMITGSDEGHLVVWNLETQRLASQKEKAHSGPVTGLKCFPSEPLLITSSPDNSIRLWIMDDEMSGVRLHKFKEGHAAPPNRIAFYGDSGTTILSAGKDSCLRAFSLEAEFLGFSLGKALFNRKQAKKSTKTERRIMPEIVDFYAQPTREGEWDNIVAVHSDLREVSTWSYHRRTKGAHLLLHERFQKNLKVLPTAAVISACGNFCSIGYSTGHVDRYNIQSGIHRLSYGQPTAHVGAVSSIAPDSMNLLLITCGDTTVKFWNFKSGALLDVYDCGIQPKLMRTYRENAFLAVALTNFAIVLMDIEIRRVIRTFVGHKGGVTDMTFSPNSRWLVSAARDCSIRVWDLSTASMVDSFRVPVVCVSLTFSPTGEYLATAHQDDVAISLWTNKSVYAPVLLASMDPHAEPELLQLPETSLASPSADIPVEDEPMPAQFSSPAQLVDHFITLSLLPEHRWKNLSKQDIIRERNKPKEALKLPEKAPFFLPTIPGLETTFAITSTEQQADKDAGAKSLRMFAALSPFAESLETDEQTKENAQRPFDILAQLPISQVETEIRRLSPENGGSPKMMLRFLRCLAAGVEDGKKQELLQSYLELFIKLHSLELSDGVHQETLATVSELKRKLSECVERIENLVDQSLSVVSFLKHVAL
ncbi:WD repeat-containing protein 36-like [Paramacrobiotus metropolitanus]|uniref:WD repeat-containing protein 36-like n=1 Tax=Paramacrobiotus metropolitanus TaxID=2943436 RepID=UPI0024458E87|nr:WD repeat-containing protein 36-like [Paramacrobiotus metropolitanus]